MNPTKVIARIVSSFLMVMLVIQGAVAQNKGLDIDIDLSPEPEWYE